jgi:hypothetical protein
MDKGYVDEDAGTTANNVSLVFAAVLGIAAVGALLYFLAVA